MHEEASFFAPSHQDSTFIASHPSAGVEVPIRRQDIDFACDVAIRQVHGYRTEIAEVWEKEMPQRAPVVSVDFSMEPRGIMRVGEDCIDNPPPNLRAPPGIDVASHFRAVWEAETSKEIRDEHVVVWILLPYGDTVQAHWRHIPISPEYVRGGDGGGKVDSDGEIFGLGRHGDWTEHFF
ncbi:hypothetical protein B0H19DRAFT_91302 [Mycena capillaripes]|nr:hypothetical protein B0H19DRAFT_91302 [Mycena capillaripes]